MRLTATWSKWSAWKITRYGRKRERSLKIGKVEIAHMSQEEITVEGAKSHCWPAGMFWSVRIGHEQSYPAFDDPKPALARLRPAFRARS
jgi:hypothetical protein